MLCVTSKCALLQHAIDYSLQGPGLKWERIILRNRHCLPASLVRDGQLRKETQANNLNPQDGNWTKTPQSQKS